MDTKVRTTNITYNYDYNTGKMVGKTIRETVSDTPDFDRDDGCEIETGLELDGIIGLSPLETLLTAAAGALLGNVIYHVIKKMMDK